MLAIFYAVLITIICLVFGFNQTTFRGSEQRINHEVEVGVQSGMFPGVIVGTVDLILLNRTG